MIIEFTKEYLDDPDYVFMKGIDRNVKVHAERDGIGLAKVKGAHMLAWANLDVSKDWIDTFADMHWPFELGTECVEVKNERKS